MNSVPVRPARLSERAAYHEAGHCAAAIAFGIPIIGVIVEGDAGHLYRCPFRKSYPRVVMMQSGKDWYGDDCPFRKSYPRVAMMQSGKDWYGDDNSGSLDGSP
jgi:hypothetical protein